MWREALLRVPFFQPPRHLQCVTTACQSLFRRFADHHRTRREALVAECTQDAKLHQATVEQAKKLLPG